MATYSKDIDYSDLIRQAAAKGDYQGAAQYEQLRNQKIAGEGMNYAQTNSYAQYLGGKTSNDAYDQNTDYQALINQAAAKGDYNAAGLYERQRNAKIAGMNMTGVSKTYNYNQIPDYQSTYKPKISELVDNIQNYDYNKFLGTDEYGALRGQYERQGQRAMQDTMGEAAARTGGLASSYAVSAGQQAYGNQMSALEAAALEMYQNKKNDMRTDLSMYQGLDNTDYSRYADQLAQNNTNRQFNYTQLTNTANTAAEKAQYDQSQAEKRAATGENVGNFQGYVDSGLMTQAQADLQQKAWALKNPVLAAQLYPKYAYLATLSAAAGGSSKGGGKGGSKGGGGDAPKNELAKDQNANKSTVTAPDDAGQMRTLSAQLSKIEDSGVGVRTKAAQLIRNYFKQRLITRSHGISLLANYGIKGETAARALDA